ncbi:Glucans biosynthesis protein C [Tenacibaculum sp. 190524A02b]
MSFVTNSSKSYYKIIQVLVLLKILNRNLIMKTRRYDLDWLRVISVLAVFLHHVFMPFNGDDFHIMNDEHSKLLDDIMVYFEQFRLPILFLISGVGTVFAFSKRSWKSFIKERCKRLLIPLVFGVIFIVPFQVYYENIEDFQSFIESYPYLVSKLKVNHLWFIENLFYTSLTFIPFILFLRSSKSKVVKKYIERFSKQTGVISWCIVLVLIRVISKDYFPSNSKSFLNLSSTLYYSFFFTGGIIIATNNVLWKLIKINRKRNLMITLFFSLLFYFYYLIPEENIEPYLNLKNRWRLWYLVCALVSWSVITTVLGYAQQYLNKPSYVLGKLNESAYPFYILHQTVIIAIGYYVIQINSSIFIKVNLLLFSSLLVIFLIYYFIISRLNFFRFLFGMRTKSF